MIEPLQSALKLVGMAAVQLVARLPRFDEAVPAFTGDAAIEQTHQLVCASIAFTTKLIAVASNNDPSWETAADMEAKLIGHLEQESGGPTVAPEFQQALENLVLAATAYAVKMASLAKWCEKTETDPFELSANTREQTYQIARAAVELTLQLTILCSGEQPIARVGAQAMEEILLAHLDNAFTLPEILS